MSTYSQYATHGMGGNDLVANESYAGAVGAYRAIEENSINEFRIFESVIGCDFADAFHEAGVLNESTYESINESALSDIWAKVKTFFKKIGEKIMGILKKFKDRLVATFTRDGKELVKKFDKQITSKMNKNKMDHFKYKWSNIAIDRTEKDAFVSVIDKACVDSELNKGVQDLFNKAKDKDSKVGGINAHNYTKSDSVKAAVDKIVQEVKDTYDEDFFKDGKEQIYADIGKELKVPGMGDSCTKEELVEGLIGKDDWEDKEGLTSSDYSEIKNLLQNGGTAIKDLDSAISKVNKKFKTEIKKCEEIEKTYQKEEKGELHRNRVLSNTYATYCTRCANAYTSACVDGINAYSMAIKKVMSNARSIFVRAATFGGKSEATLMEAVDQISNYEVEQMFE